MRTWRAWSRELRLGSRGALLAIMPREDLVCVCASRPLPVVPSDTPRRILLGKKQAIFPADVVAAPTGDLEFRATRPSYGRFGQPTRAIYRVWRLASAGGNVALVDSFDLRWVRRRSVRWLCRCARPFGPKQQGMSVVDHLLSDHVPALDVLPIVRKGNREHVTWFP